MNKLLMRNAAILASGVVLGPGAALGGYEMGRHQSGPDQRAAKTHLECIRYFGENALEGPVSPLCQDTQQTLESSPNASSIELGQNYEDDLATAKNLPASNGNTMLVLGMAVWLLGLAVSSDEARNKRIKQAERSE